MTKVLWADFKSDLSDTRQHWHISFRYGWYISKCYRWYISFRYDWHNSFRCRWHIDSVAINKCGPLFSDRPSTAKTEE